MSIRESCNNIKFQLLAKSSVIGGNETAKEKILPPIEQILSAFYFRRTAFRQDAWQEWFDKMTFLHVFQGFVCGISNVLCLKRDKNTSSRQRKSIEIAV